MLVADGRTEKHTGNIKIMKMHLSQEGTRLAYVTGFAKTRHNSARTEIRFCLTLKPDSGTIRPGATILKVIRPTGDLISTDCHDSELFCKHNQHA